MGVKVISIEVSKETHELGQGIRSFVGHVRKALSDGWQPNQDIPVVLQAAFADLVPQIQDAEKISKEPSENKRAFTKAINDSSIDLAFDFVGPA